MFVRPRHLDSHRGSVTLCRKVAVTRAALTLARGVTVAAQGGGASTARETDRPLLRVVASPDIAAAVAWVAEGVRDAGGCPGADVRAEAGLDVLTALRQSSPPPDAWIPDSSLW